MLRKIIKLSKPALTKISLILLFSFVCALLFFNFALAEGVNLNVEVKERKPTDTINDFRFSPAPSMSPEGRVLGAQSERNPQKSMNIFIILLLINPLLLI